MGKPAVEIGRIDVLHQGDLAFLLKVGLHEPESRAMAFERFGAVVAAGVIEQVIGDGTFNRCFSAVARPISFALCSRRSGSRRVLCRASTGLGLDVEFGALGAGPRLGHLARPRAGRPFGRW